MDYDGTLAEFTPTPDDRSQRPEVVSLLTRLAQLPRSRVMIISGRSLASLEAMLPVPGAFLAGTYGVEILTPAQELIRRIPLETLRPVVEQVKHEWAEILDSRPGFYLEDKGWTIAIHARLAEPQEALRVLADARAHAPTGVLEENGLVLFSGWQFLELAPQDASKARSVDYLLEHFPLPEALLVYIGDDNRDEPAFRVVNAHGGMSVLVSPVDKTTQAQYRLEQPAAVRTWLAGIAETFA
jgi:trehalose 6-phosphate phosphatase